jgi:hypothetical protein
MKVAKRQVDFDTVELTISATGRANDNQNLPDGLTHLPFNGNYTIDWGDGGPLETIAAGANPSVVVTHNYTQHGSFRGYVEGDARIRFHALSTAAAA